MVIKSLNFEFLRNGWPQLTELGGFAERYLDTDPQSACTKMRLFAEEMTRGLYRLLGLERLPEASFMDLLTGGEFRARIPSVILDKLHTVRIRGNKAAHGSKPTPAEALELLRQTFDIARWLFVSQGKGAIGDLPAFRHPTSLEADDEAKGRLKREKKEALQKLATQEVRLDALLREVATEREARQLAGEEIERLRAEFATRGPAAVSLLRFDEVATRRRLIDLMLADAGWDVGADGASTDEVRQEVEVLHQPTPTGKGAADYVLWNDDGTPLAVVEAKKTAEEPDKGKTQARLYADGLERMHGRRPVIFYTNGHEVWIWDDAQGYPPRKLFGLYGKDSLQLLHFQRANARPLDRVMPKPEIVDRLYQATAIRSVAEKLAAKRRKGLIVQATGTGKTRVAVALAEMLGRADWVKRVLFLCDRKELRKQAKQAFVEHTAHTTVVVTAGTAKERQHRVYLATYPAMMKVFQTFDPGFFDLIVADESHRSIYNVYRDIFRWFDAIQIGLTATPVELVSRSTCRLFDCDFKHPTYAYGYEEAVADRYVVPFELYTHTTQFLRDGIRSDQLTDEQIAQLEDQGEDPNALDFDAAEIDKVVYSKGTNRAILRNLMEHGIRDATGQQLGKSIVFARNHRHAVLLRDLFDELYPQYGGKFCQVIDNYDPRAEALIDEFKDPLNALTIAVSVDMLDTGIDVPEVVNLVFAKPVKSKIKFWQMIGRGTRLCPDLFGPGKDKTVFRIFDHWGNFAYFGTSYAEAEVAAAKGLVQRLFEARLALAETALRQGKPDVFEAAVELLRQDIAALPGESIAVRERWREVRAVADPAVLHAFAPATVQVLRDDIAPLMQWRDIRGHAAAYELDLLVAQMQQALLLGSGELADLKAELLERVDALPPHLNQVREKQPTIQAVKQPGFWDPAHLSVAVLERVRTELRSVMRHRPVGPPPAQPVRVLDIDEDPAGIRLQRERSRVVGIDLATYRAQVLAALESLFETDPTLARIRRGEAVGEADLERLTSLVLTQNPGVDLATLREFYAATEPLERIICSIVGMDAATVRERFATFAQKHALGAKQLQFLQLLQNHVARHGSIELDRLYQAPFTQIDAEGLDGVFADEAQADDLIAILADFEKPAESTNPPRTEA